MEGKTKDSVTGPSMTKNGHEELENWKKWYNADKVGVVEVPYLPKAGATNEEVFLYSSAFGRFSLSNFAFISFRCLFFRPVRDQLISACADTRRLIPGNSGKLCEIDVRTRSSFLVPRRCYSWKRFVWDTSAIGALLLR